MVLSWRSAMELTMMYVIAGGLFLLTIVLMFMLKNIMDKVSDLEDANDGVLSKLNISQKKGDSKTASTTCCFCLQATSSMQASLNKMSRFQTTKAWTLLQLLEPPRWRNHLPSNRQQSQQNPNQGSHGDQQVHRNIVW